jgi:hypothetical protein
MVQTCSKCRLILQGTVERELADFPDQHTTMSPPFYAIQIDIAMGFKPRLSNESKKCFPAYALVIVCLLTSATNVLVLDGITTQTVIQALERHSARYGVPAQIFVDAGRQLAKLQDASFQLQDLRFRNFPGMTFEVHVCPPKAHQEQGRVESKIKQLKETLQQLSESTTVCNTLLGWETTFSLIANRIDSLPIARGSASAASDLGWEVITANRLKLGRNNHRQLVGHIQITSCPQAQLTRNQLISTKWYQIFQKRIPLLIPSPAKKEECMPSAGDVVVFVASDLGRKRNWNWKLGIIERQLTKCRFAIRFLSDDGITQKIAERNTNEISVIVPANKLPPTHPEFLHQLQEIGWEQL